MGLRDSPYRSLQMLLIAKTIAYGDRRDRNNPFHWEEVILNLPGSWHYDPTMPWVYKLRWDKNLACEIYIYVDDGKTTGWSRLACWQASRRFASVCSHLGIQDAARKRTEPSRTPGPWAGSVIHTEDGVRALVTQKKWDKIKSLIAELEQMSKLEKVPRKRLEQIRGFFNYVARTYKWMVPYMKGLHLTIDGWREGRDRQGWKVKKPAGSSVVWEWESEKWIDVTPEQLTAIEGSDNLAPDLVVPVERFRSDVNALMELTDRETPPSVLCRATSSLSACYLMGDASGKGFGSALWSSDGIRWESGNYSYQYRMESSNFREADNLVSKLEDLGTEGTLLGKELFVFTDNSVFEGTFYKGHSPSQKLNSIVLRLRKVEREAGCILHVLHLAGTRMKASGIDGLSRGDMMEGMLRSGTDPMRFVPLDEDANERSGEKVEAWVKSWWSGASGEPWCGSHLRRLTPTDWFSLYDVEQPRLWIPPPLQCKPCLNCLLRIEW